MKKWVAGILAALFVAVVPNRASAFVPAVPPVVLGSSSVVAAAALGPVGWTGIGLLGLGAAGLAAWKFLDDPEEHTVPIPDWLGTQFAHGATGYPASATISGLIASCGGGVSSCVVPSNASSNTIAANSFALASGSQTYYNPKVSQAFNTSDVSLLLIAGCASPVAWASCSDANQRGVLFADVTGTWELGPATCGGNYCWETGGFAWARAGDGPLAMGAGVVYGSEALISSGAVVGQVVRAAGLYAWGMTEATLDGNWSTNYAAANGLQLGQMWERVDSSVYAGAPGAALCFDLGVAQASMPGCGWALVVGESPAVPKEEVTVTYRIYCSDDGGTTVHEYTSSAQVGEQWIQVPHCEGAETPTRIVAEIEEEEIGSIDYDPTPDLSPTPIGVPDGTVLGEFDPSTGLVTGAVPTPDDGLTPEQGNCWAGALSFNPLDWVVTPLKCLFIPDHFPDFVVPEFGDWLPVFAFSDVGCGGYAYGFSGPNGFELDGELPTTCSGLGAQVASVSTFVSGGLLVFLTVRYTYRRFTAL